MAQNIYHTIEPIRSPPPIPSNGRYQPRQNSQTPQFPFRPYVPPLPRQNSSERQIHLDDKVEDKPEDKVDDEVDDEVEDKVDDEVDDEVEDKVDDEMGQTSLLEYLTAESEPSNSIEENESSKLRNQLPRDENYNIPGKDKRGIGLIFTNDEIFPSNEKPSGPNEDTENLKNMFSEMKLTVSVYENRTSKQIINILTTLASDELNNTHYVLFVVFSTWSVRNDTIYGSDKTGISLNNEIVPLFKRETCPVLQGKPKIFLIQACSWKKVFSNERSIVRDAHLREEVITNESDILVAFAKDSTRFIHDLCKNYSHYAKRCHFQEILTLTNQSLLQQFPAGDTGHNIDQTLHVTSTLRKFVRIEPVANEVGYIDPVFVDDHVSLPQILDSGPKALASNVGDEVENDDMKDKNISYAPTDQYELFKYDVIVDKYKPYSGLGIILVNHSNKINVQNRKDQNQRTERKGSHEDLKNYEDLFHEMKLKTITISDFNRKLLETITEKLKENKNLKIFFIAISTHGYQKDNIDKLALYDGTSVKVDEIVDIFQNDCIAGKPKVLLIQACRGNLQDTNKPSPPASDCPPSQATQESDMLVAYACPKGYIALRDEEEGSWFPTELKRRYHEMKGRYTFTQILTAVNDRMIKDHEYLNSMETTIKQTCEYRSTLRGDLYI